jgi:membrane associated rhomboid family serine protease
MCILPLGDDNSDRRSTPVLNYALIAINVIVFFVFQGMGNNIRFTYALSTVPQEIVSGTDVVTADRVVTHPQTGEQFELPGLQPTPFSVYLTLLTSMFMHGGLAHLFGNMLFLWIFGDNLEDALGKPRYLVFYLLTGLAASLAHVAVTFASGGDPLVPSLGASGAISGVLGGYLVLFPRRRVNVMVMRMITQMPAIAAVGIWFAFQLVMGLGSLGAKGGGVAYGAHIGGFVAGLALVKLFALGRDLTPAIAHTGRPRYR